MKIRGLRVAGQVSQLRLLLNSSGHAEGLADKKSVPGAQRKSSTSVKNALWGLHAVMATSVCVRLCNRWVI